MTAMDERPVRAHVRPAADADTLIGEIEGHLLAEAARAESRAAAQRFAQRLDWLSPAERAEVERLYAEDHLSVTRQAWRHIAGRCLDLRAEYEERYRVLRRRVLAGGLLVAGVLVGVGTVLALA
ncbi:hypothetical protein SMD44_04547 [Streptomyces alboflavus]|uniref:Cytochrome C oxidase subunit I n=2 Tax=Streptomyces alboflavus TaxID=67267 RepID=A0A1Z1WFB5_9ACTN|nr:hypothetical protein [Streptomyces alboflavus]ARX85089.1 hypothetical protein SMD44_04547 [Streptomyces alboflavus]